MWYDGDGLVLFMWVAGDSFDMRRSGKIFRAEWLLAMALCIGTCVVFQNAVWAEDAGNASVSGGHWAYRAVVRPATPVVVRNERVRTPIDAFVLQKLADKSLQFAPDAPPHELLRRAKLDLLGLPPTPEELAEFASDSSPDAYERLLDRLLDSPQYGERWGRMWLDVVRYADTAGYNADPLRPLAYQYRDYVIRAFNQDVPFNRFVEEQLAGDELFPDRADAAIALGFHRLPPDESNASDVWLARQDQLNDLTAGIGSIFLAQTLGCAQCHDHKFDPISQKDFYRMQAFFAGVVPVESLPVADATEQERYRQELQSWLARTEAIRRELQRMEARAREIAWNDKRSRFPEPVWETFNVPRENRTALQQQLAFFTERQIEVTEKNMIAALNVEEKARRTELTTELERHKQDRPKPPRMQPVLAAVDATPVPPTHRLAGGSYAKPLEEVQPGFLNVLAPVLSPGVTPDADAPIAPPRSGVIGRRTTLARWLINERNPLTARVFVNRVWQAHFSRGLAKNANDFGTQSPAPTHPELLDWIVSEWLHPSQPGEIPWSIKRLQKLIMRSTVYRQASDRRSDAVDQPGKSADPANVLYWCFPRQRLTAEQVRDSLLAVSGRLNPAMFGPGVRPELPYNFSTREAWPLSTEPADHDRRSIYILAKRNLPYPLLQVFDLPDMHESCAARQVTTTGPQALTLLNSHLVLRYAQGFAGRILYENPQGAADVIVRDAWRTALSREPASDELREGVAFLHRQREAVAAGEVERGPELLPRPMPKFLEAAWGAAIVDLCHALLNSNEFLYVE